ncbi:MAG: glycosyltransferase [Actinomycetota bacterium]
MRRRLRLFVLVGLLATAVDLSVLAVLREPLGLVWADVVALTVAATVAYLANRTLTFRGDPAARWVRRPMWFAATALLAGSVDLIVLLGFDALGAPLLVAKLIAIASAVVIRWIAYRRILFARVRRELAERVPRPPMEADLRLSVVIPAYCEGSLIGPTIRQIAEAIEVQIGSDHYEILVVDDGSTDDTVDRATEAGARVEQLPENRGKGGAVRAGMLAARGRAVIFTDADLAYTPDLVLTVLDHVEDGWDVVVGSRRHDDTNTLVRARRIRELGGRVINLLTHIVLLGNFHDTQCGLKGFRGDVARTIFERTRVDGFAFDVEIFLIAEQDRLSLTEVPVSVTNRAGSSVSIVRDSIAVVSDLFRIRRWAGAGLYDATEAQAAVLAPLAVADDRGDGGGTVG